MINDHTHDRLVEVSHRAIDAARDEDDQITGSWTRDLITAETPLEEANHLVRILAYEVAQVLGRPEDDDHHSVDAQLQAVALIEATLARDNESTRALRPSNLWEAHLVLAVMTTIAARFTQAQWPGDETSVLQNLRASVIRLADTPTEKGQNDD